MEVAPFPHDTKESQKSETWANKLNPSTRTDNNANNDHVHVTDVIDSSPEACTTKHNGNSNDNPGDEAAADDSSSKKDRKLGLKTHTAKILNPRGNGVEKLVFTISIGGLMLAGYGVVAFPWILPYFYSGAAPLLMTLRIWLYWEQKWQLFLVDFCYFANLVCLIYLWACPSLAYLFYVAFAVANGPLLFAIITYRNTLAFHSLDRMTSVFIHLLPSLVTFAIRWYPNDMRWYSSFVAVDAEIMSLPWLWLLGVPYGFYILHTVIYYTVVYVIIKPNKDYWDTYRYMTGEDSGKFIAKLVNILGTKYTPVVFISANWTYTLLTFLFSVLWFKYFIAHCVFLSVIGLVLTWNGASFYLDVFSVKGLDAEPYRFCLK